MILQGNLRLEYLGNFFSLMVKTYLKNNVYYFYVSEKEEEASLLAGETLEFTFTDSLCTSEKEDPLKESKVSDEIIDAVKQLLLQNKKSWYYQNLAISSISETTHQ
jgi:hypothetical protein